MKRFVHGLTSAVALACCCTLAFPQAVRADTPRPDRQVGAAPGPVAVQSKRPRIAAPRKAVRQTVARIPRAEPEIAAPNRYVSLLILGVAY